MSQPTIKRYWSAHAPTLLKSFTKEQREKWNAFDAELTPDDIREMQTIDADCNDCAHFKRGKMEKVPGLTMFRGHCQKLDKPTNAFPGQFSGHQCFQHRKDPCLNER